MSKDVVQTTSGRVQGRQADAAWQFLGIPFTAPFGPGARFRPPAPPAGWSGILTADSMPHPVPQIPDDGGATHTHLWSSYYPIPPAEDGLALNLWTPEPGSGASLPVMVWLHGGGFATGQPTRPREMGTSFAGNEHVVVVAPTHRLGATGYLYLDQLSGGEYQTANLGMQDILAVLEWVRDNISSFGGNPANVTVFGESGGAAKTHALMAMPAARGLFHRAILQAGAMSEFGPIGARSPTAASELSERYLHLLGLAPQEAAKLQELTMDELIRADVALSPSLTTWSPVVDGTVLPEAPSAAAAAGRLAEFSLIVGSSRYEMDVLTDSPGVNRLAALQNADRDQLLQLYRANRPGQPEREAELALLTDLTFRVPGIALAEAQAAAGQPDVYMYLFDYRYHYAPDPAFRATHGSETAFAFNTTDATAVTSDDPEARELARAVHASWAAFARDGKPGHQGLDCWARYDSGNRATTLLTQQPRIVTDPDGAERAAWTTVADPDQ